jgi:hypothetical protein
MKLLVSSMTIWFFTNYRQIGRVRTLKNVVIGSLIAIFVGSLVGCEPGNTYETAPVSGNVTMDGKPLEGAEIYFIGEGMTAFAVTDANGQYQFERGAVVGENQVYFRRMVGEMALDSSAEIDATQLEAMAAAQGPMPGKNVPRQVIPSTYSDPAHPHFKFPVPQTGTTAADFDIKSK